MSEIKIQYYLWGIWIFWGGGIVAFALSRSIPLLIALSGMGFFSLLLIMQKRHAKRTIISMFKPRKKETAQTGNTDQLTEKSERAVTLNLQPVEENSMKETVISLGTVLRGEIVNENNITLNGIVEGNITCQKFTQIGKEGQLTGTVMAQKLIVNGLLKGSCYAQTVIIMSRGRVEGDIHAGEFLIEKGGVFIGNSHLLEENNDLSAKKGKKLSETSGSQHASSATDVTKLSKSA